ncbi:hypothetical protein SCHIN_v1c11750 [Spiroplasma chinense]|uniref:Uncharacterized protein n=1 Tax=Spiroplasma chinense TaxID=216932 RepID=A0A5B9Y5C3_9MOLU|nr:hypothetical protein [Spiroplasma chinense]QEH62368.1 hypothetical protein SCHIN_v1c11750 [Spiroplasma chinense]
MYVNPFERMKKKREEAEKLKQEAEKEREKYARLGAQMGFTQDKGVMPSFIKSLIGETNQTNVPPFGMGAGSPDSSGPAFMPSSTPSFGAPDMGSTPSFGSPDMGGSPSFGSPMEQTSTITPSFGAPDMGGSPSFGSMPANNMAPSFGSPMEQTSTIAPSFGAPDMGSTPSFGAPMQETAPAAPSFGSPMEQQTPAAPSFGAPDMGSTPSFGSPMEQQTPAAPSFGSPMEQQTTAAPSFGSPMEQQTTAAPSFGAPDMGSTPSFGSMPANNMAPSFGSPMEQQVSMTQNMGMGSQQNNVVMNQPRGQKIGINNFINEINNNSQQGQIFALVGGDTHLNELTKQFINLLPQNKKVEIEMKEVHMYAAPFLFLLKQIVNNVPLVSLDDKRALWERTSLLLAATEYGKTGSEVDLIMDGLGLADPIENIRSEFKQLSFDYNLDQTTSLMVLTGFNQLEITQSTKTVQFINTIFHDMHEFKFVFEFSESFMSLAQTTDTVAQIVGLIDSYIVAGDVPITNNNQMQNQTPQAQNFEAPDMGGGPGFGSPMQETAPVAPNFGAPDMGSTPSFGSPMDQTGAPQFGGMPSNFQEVATQPSFEAPLTPQQPQEMNNFNVPMSENAPPPQSTGQMPQQTFGEGPVSSASFEAPGGFTSPSNSTPSSVGFGLPSSLIQEEEEPEEEYDPGLDGNIRIRVDLNLQRRAEEALERERQEEQARLERTGQAGFNPAILAKSNAPVQSNAPGQKVFENMSMHSNNSLESTRVEDPRGYDAVHAQLQGMANAFENRPNISIAEATANEARKKTGENLIKVTGNWKDLNK